MAPVQNPPPSNDSTNASDGSRRFRTLVWALLLATALLYGTRLGHLDFWAPDEPRYGAIAEELRSFRHGAPGLLLLHLNDAPYTQKPPLYFWLAAIAGAPGGRVTEWAARLPSALAGIGSVALTVFIARRLRLSPMLSIWAAGMLATSFRFAFTARRAQLDVLLTFFELLAIALFLGWEFRARSGSVAAQTAPVQEASSRERPSRMVVAGLHAALGAAALVKGPVAWLPLAIFAAYLAWEGRIRSFRRIAPAWAWVLSLAPVAIWILAAISLAPTGFAEVAVTDNLIGRFFSGTSHARPFYYFAYQMPADFMPWALLLPIGIVWLWRGDRDAPVASDAGPPRLTASDPAPARFVWVWLVVPLLFFSLSAGKRGVYLLPIFPALSIVAAIGASRLVDRHLTAPTTVLRVLGAIAILELAVFTWAAPTLEPEKSPRPIALSAARHSMQGEAIGVYGLEPIEGAIAYYGDRPVVSLDEPHDLATFLDSSGGVALMRARHFDAFRERMGLRALESFRADRRKLVLASRPRTESPALR